MQSQKISSIKGSGERICTPTGTSFSGNFDYLIVATLTCIDSVVDSPNLQVAI